MGLINSIKHAWSIFTRDPTYESYERYGGRSYREDINFRRNYYNAQSMVSSLYHFIAIQASMVKFKHIKVNDEGEELEVLKTGLQHIFSIEANIDQSSIHFLYDIVYSMYDQGTVAIVPTKVNDDTLARGGAIDPLEMRCCKILEYYPKSIKVEVYNDATDEFEQLIVPKKYVAIIDNPMMTAMAGINSQIQRLTTKLGQVDKVDAMSTGTKLDILVHLPFDTSKENRKKVAQDHMKSIEEQLQNSKYGIGYLSSMDKVTQLNRPAINTLLDEIKMMEENLYNIFGITKNIMDGTASEDEILHFYQKTIDPVLEIIRQEFYRKYISRYGREELKEDITYYRNMFALTSVDKMAASGDLLLRNAVVTPNEMRRLMGLARSTDPQADKLYNRNIAESNQLGGKTNGEDPLKSIKGGNEDENKS